MSVQNRNIGNVRGRRQQLLKLAGKIVLGMGVVMTTGTIISFYLLKRWILKQRDDMIQLQRMQQQISGRFTQTSKDTGHTVSELVPVLGMILNKHGLDLDQLFQTLKSKSKINPDNGAPQDNNNTSSKVQLWEDLKLKSLVKLVTTIYTLSTLYLLLTLQLNILARRDYLETAIKEAIEKESGSGSISIGGVYKWIKGKCWNTMEDPISQTDETKQMGRDKITYINEQGFLSMSWWLLNRGWEQYYQLVENIVSVEFNDLTVRDKVTKQEFEQRLRRVFNDINGMLIGGSSSNDDSAIEKEPLIVLEEVILPDETMEAYTLLQTLDDDSMALLYDDTNRVIISQLLSETRSYIQMNSSHAVMNAMIAAAVNTIINSVNTNIDVKSKNPVLEQDQIDPNTYPIAMFTLSVKDYCSQLLSSRDSVNVTMEAMVHTKELDEFASGVYCNFEI
ncbi:peroxisomal biogenesis factor 3 [Monosporozyma unispora]|nr:peroxin [Kazachstania unispora]